MNHTGQLNGHQLVEHFTPLVRRITSHLMARLPANVQADDLEQNGMLGLLDALNRFQSDRGAQFETYASQRVRGAMLDGLRKNDWLPFWRRRDSRHIDVCISQLEQRHGRVPKDEELADALGKTLDGYQKMRFDAWGQPLVYIEDMAGEGGESFLDHHIVDQNNEPSAILEERELQQSLAEGVAALPERDKLLMTLHYEQDMNLHEIGEVLGISGSRVSQLHGKIVARLRVHLLGLASPA
jgi:RNA polymerase sigma factor FliA